MALLAGSATVSRQAKRRKSDRMLAHGAAYLAARQNEPCGTRNILAGPANPAIAFPLQLHFPWDRGLSLDDALRQT